MYQRVIRYDSGRFDSYKRNVQPVASVSGGEQYPMLLSNIMAETHCTMPRQHLTHQQWRPYKGSKTSITSTIIRTAFRYLYRIAYIPGDIITAPIVIKKLSSVLGIFHPTTLTEVVTTTKCMGHTSSKDRIKRQCRIFWHRMHTWYAPFPPSATHYQLKI